MLLAIGLLAAFTMGAWVTLAVSGPLAEIGRTDHAGR